MKKELVNGLKKVLFAAAVVTTLAAVNPQNTEAAAKPKMDRAKVTCTAKERFTLKVKNAKGKKIKWSSTKKSVATVSKKGVVVAKKAGKATIKAKVGSKTVKCAVTVKKNASQPWMTAKTKTLHVGESFLLIEGWFTDYESVFSFNDRIATADGSGRITATGVGTVTIRVNRGQDSNGRDRNYFCEERVESGAAKACKHCWMDARDSKGHLLGIKNFREEGHIDCITCGAKFLDENELFKHRESTGHAGSRTAGGGYGSSVGKFGSPTCPVPQQYCRLCGEVK